jgi:hypothetical protein
MRKTRSSDAYLPVKWIESLEQVSSLRRLEALHKPGGLIIGSERENLDLGLGVF